ncbi:MAG: ABC transporter substrate-binding protein [Candidatus Tectomicrobia bacterium]|nr:ABC transporter substrate-binding protein [Candidatus Tectomicrobia bacterium]
MMQQRRGLFRWSMAACLGGLILVGMLAGPAVAQQTLPLKVGLMRIVGVIPTYAAIDRGFFKEAGVDFQPTDMAGGAVILPAISGGSLDVGFTNVVSLFMARDQGFDYTIVAGNTYENKILKPDSPLGYIGTSALMVLPDSPIKTVKDLEGKTIAINTRRTILTMAVEELMSQKGADPSTVKWIEVPFPRMAAPLKMKQVDAIMDVQPFVTIFEAKEGLRVLDYPLAGIRKETIPVALWAAREAWMRDNREVLNRFIKANNKGIEYVNQYPEERKRLAAANLKMDPKVAERVVWQLWKTKVDIDDLQWVSDLALKWKLIQKKQNVRSFVYQP